MGSRYGGLKQMDPIGPNGEFLLDYSVAFASDAGFERTVFVIRRDIEADFREIVGKRWEARTDVAYAFQSVDDLCGFTQSSISNHQSAIRTKPWGTGHAVLAARGVLDGSFAVVNADDFYDEPPFAALSRFLDDSAAQPNSHAMAAYRLDKTLSEFGSVSRGVCNVGDGGMLLEMREKTALKRGADGLIRNGDEPEVFPPDTPVSMNLFAFKRSFVDALESEFPAFLAAHGSDPKKEFFMSAELDKLVQAGRAKLAVLRTNAEWAGITCREDREEVAAKLRGIKPVF